jgi:hypothetical protein
VAQPPIEFANSRHAEGSPNCLEGVPAVAMTPEHTIAPHEHGWDVASQRRGGYVPRRTSLNAILQLMMIPAYTFWSLSTFTVDIFAMYGSVACGTPISDADQ